MDPHPARRDVLRAGGLAALAAGAGGLLAACGRDEPTPAASTTTPTAAGSSSSAPAPTFAELAPQVAGGLALAGAAGYDASALLYNPRFAQQTPPQAIAHCASADDVAACVRFAAAGGAPLRIRNGGHSYGGWSSGPGLVADLAPMAGVAVDTGGMTATVGAGALLVGVYAALAAQGVAIGAGSCPTVGVTGLTLGGGVGVLARSFGLTCDQVRSFDVVTADGRARTVDADRDPDLFWALRGGGAGLAAVTALTFAVRPAPTVSRFFLQWPVSAAPTVVAAWQEWIAAAPAELWSTCKVLSDPGRGTTVSVSGTWIGTGSADAQLERLRQHTPAPDQDSIRSAGYGDTMLAEAGCAGQDAASCVADALAPAKRQPFAASSSIVTQPLSDAAINAIVGAASAGLDVPGLIEGGVSFDGLGGAVAEVAAADTAFPWRDALATVQYTATWAYSDAGVDPAPYDGFVRAERAALAPWLGDAAYVNYADASITDFGTAYWGDNLARLRQVKQTYDPADVFSTPQGVPAR